MLSFFKAKPEPHQLDYSPLNIRHFAALGEKLSAQYRYAEPYPHIVIDDFLPEHMLDSVLEHFPTPQDKMWFDWRKGDTENQPKKQGVRHIERMEGAHPYLFHILNNLNSFAITNFLEKLTGIEGLIADPHFHGGALHQILRGGKLKIHADFNYLEKLQLYRRINVLLYLNKNWKEDYGGHVELWDKNMRGCVHKIAPIFNRCVIFNTDSTSYHGHPEPLDCPEHITRKSIALYYYTSAPHDEAASKTHHSTLWQELPAE
jgi:2OG-Fe(II) oxygenase superfamily